MTPFCIITSAAGKVTTYDRPEDAWADLARAAARQPTTFIGVVGSRRRNTFRDQQHCWRYMQAFEYDAAVSKGHRVVFVSGLCKMGADWFAHRYACEDAHDRTTIVEFPAQWDKFGLSAGHKRNEHIARLCDILLAQAAPDRTGGTEGTIAWARKLGRKVHII